MSGKPIRLQLSRKRGFDLQAASRAANGLDAVNVARPSRWGNPYDFRGSEFCWAALHLGERADAAGRRAASVRAFRTWLDTAGIGTVAETNYGLVGEVDGRAVDIGSRAVVKVGRPAPTRTEIVAALRGKNLACWCALDAPCHADVLLEIANGLICEATQHPARAPDMTEDRG